MSSNNGFIYGGIRIVESKFATEPKIQLSKNVMVTDKFREKCNKFYLEFFGVKPSAYMINSDSLIAHPEIIEAIKKAASSGL